MDYRLSDRDTIKEFISNYLTSSFIANPTDLPDDECDSETEFILTYIEQKLSEGCEDAREKIAKIVWESECNVGDFDNADKVWKINNGRRYYELADQILQEVLIPEIEKAKKEGREEVIEWQQNHKVIGFCFDTSDEDEEQDLRLAWSLQLKEWSFQSPSGVEEDE
uniref:Uncharacterized protein n=1 Tax=viral metagenome TaxID=1070528 RepID=A0A6M3K547_9ZZZZ